MDDYDFSQIAKMFPPTNDEQSFELQGQGLPNFAMDPVPRPFSPAYNNPIFNDIFIPERSPQMQSVEELRRRRRMQSVSARAPYTVPLDDYSFNGNTFEDYSQIWSPSHPTHEAASPSSSSSSFEHHNTYPETLHAVATRRRDPARKLVSIHYLEDMRRRKMRQTASPFPMPMPGYVPDYSDNDVFDPYSPPSTPPSYPSPSSFGSFSPSPSPPFSSSSSSSSSGSYSSMHQAQSFIHPEAMGGPSAGASNRSSPYTGPPLQTVNMGYAQVPLTLVPPTQYPMDRRDDNYNYRHNINTQPEDYYYAHTDSNNFGPSYPTPAAPSCPKYQTLSNAQYDTGFQGFNNAMPQYAEPHQSSNPPPSQSPYYHPSSSFAATSIGAPTFDAQHNHGGHGLLPRHRNSSLRQSGARSARHQPYPMTRTEEQAGYYPSTNGHTSVQQLPLQKGRGGSHTRRHNINGSALHHGEMEPRYKERFDRRLETGASTSSKASLVERNLRRPPKPSQSGPTEAIVEDDTQEKQVVPTSTNTNRGFRLRWWKSNMKFANPTTPPEEPSPPKRQPEEKTGAVMTSTEVGDGFVVVSGKVVPDKE